MGANLRPGGAEPEAHLVADGVAASVFRLGAEGHAAHQPGPRQRRHAVVVNGEDAQLVVPRRRQVAQQEVLVIGRNHPGREAETAALRPPTFPDAGPTEPNQRSRWASSDGGRRGNGRSRPEIKADGL